MREVIILIGIAALGLLSTLVIGLKTQSANGVNPAISSPATQQSLTTGSPQNLVADMPPPEDRGAPGRRS